MDRLKVTYLDHEKPLELNLHSSMDRLKAIDAVRYAMSTHIYIPVWID